MNHAPTLSRLSLTHSQYPQRLKDRLGAGTPKELTALGNLNLLSLPKTAYFCSTRCPGDPILAACDQAARWREEGRCVISGFHSPVEQECLRILLAGKQPIIICPARSLVGMRIPIPWRDGSAQGRILLLSPFPATVRRQTAALCRLRNEFVVALADDLYIPYVTPGGNLEHIAHLAQTWGIPRWQARMQ